MDARFCPECGERLEVSVYDGKVVYLCYDCEFVLTPKPQSARVSRRERKTPVSRSVVLVAY